MKDDDTEQAPGLTAKQTQIVNRRLGTVFYYLSQAAAGNSECDANTLQMLADETRFLSELLDAFSGGSSDLEICLKAQSDRNIRENPALAFLRTKPGGAS